MKEWADLRSKYLGRRYILRRSTHGIVVLWHSILLSHGVSAERERAFSDECSQWGAKGDAADVRVRPGVPGPHRCYARQRAARAVPGAQHPPRRTTSCMQAVASKLCHQHAVACVLHAQSAATATAGITTLLTY